MPQPPTPPRRQALWLGLATVATAGCASGPRAAPAADGAHHAAHNAARSLASAHPADAAQARAQAQAQVRQAERAFSAAMAARDLTAFAAFIAEDAVFINGGRPLRGKAAILAVWRGFFEGPVAPFTWQPEVVEVAANGQLGYSEGPVTARNGTSSLRYFSTWALQADGRWLVVFDNGTTVCKA